jgi:methionine synthase II (cobalamin-independent)
MVGLGLIDFPSNYLFMETLVEDVGSFPLPSNISRQTFNQAYRLAREQAAQGKDLTKDEFLQKNFCKVVLDSFRKTLATGLDITNFPQQYDGMSQVGDVLHMVMEKQTFLVEEKNAVLPEVYLIRQQAKALSEECGRKIALRVCIFGPMEFYLREVGYTPHQEALDQLAETIRRFVKNSLFNDKYIQTKVVSIDEPSFGYNNIEAPPEVLCGVLEKTFDFNGATREIHLHSTKGFSDLLAVKGLDVLSFEYAASPENIDSVPKSLLERGDKQIRVGIARTDIDNMMGSAGKKTGDLEKVVESVETIRKRFLCAKEKFGERMTFTGPDCGLAGFPTQESAALLLRRTVEAVRAAP